MKRFGKLLAGSAVFAFGYTCGIFQAGSPADLQAVAQPDRKIVEAVSNETLEAYVKFRKGGSDLADSLRAESLNTVAVEGINFFALSVGGVDAVRDLEEGRGVDPETFAAIYADRASTEVTQHVDTDAEGRKRYKGAIVRMYSKERLREIFQRRDQIEIRSKRL